MRHRELLPVPTHRDTGDHNITDIDTKRHDTPTQTCVSLDISKRCRGPVTLERPAEVTAN
ncbi:hypothetical protein MANY_10950 [Mycolicibacterium anyangense]|uniref:Uncharacterized protein n=1 Tax=Mycolicibacterium anyangense TaxID=1431246 RepID=A0A6N4W5F9_9MYCO|nr:hypothetical protein MANY_10950 [Mycolicibacterium anyangense]